MGNARKRFEDLTKAIELDPKNSESYYKRAEAYANTEQFWSAEQDRQMARKLLEESESKRGR